MTETLLSIFAYRHKKRKIEDIPPHHLVIVIPTKTFLGIPLKWEAFYCFDNLSSLPQVRTNEIDAYLKQDADMNIDGKTLDLALATLLNCLDPSEGKLKVLDAILIVKEMQKRRSMITLPEHVYRIAAMCFFKSEKELYDDYLSPDEIERRAELLKKKIPLGELFRESTENILTKLGWSKEDFESYSKFQALHAQLLADKQRKIFYTSAI